MEVSPPLIAPHKPRLLFRLGMEWRIFYGALRIILGISLLRVIDKTLAELVYALMSHEITGQRSDEVLEIFYRFFEIHQFSVTYFFASYFIFWGTVDIVLSICLLKGIKRAFPIAMGIIVLFICYGLFRYTHTHSLVLLTVICVDMGILYLVREEYKKIR